MSDNRLPYAEISIGSLNKRPRLEWNWKSITNFSRIDNDITNKSRPTKNLKNYNQYNIQKQYNKIETILNRLQNLSTESATKEPIVSNETKN